jgi:hypothetical protein
VDPSDTSLSVSKKAAHLGRVAFRPPIQVIQMHLGEIEALAVGQDGSRPGPIAEEQLPGLVAYSLSRPSAVAQERPI